MLNLVNDALAAQDAAKNVARQSSES